MQPLIFYRESKVQNKGTAGYQYRIPGSGTGIGTNVNSTQPNFKYIGLQKTLHIALIVMHMLNKTFYMHAKRVSPDRTVDVVIFHRCGDIDKL